MITPKGKVLGGARPGAGAPLRNFTLKRGARYGLAEKSDDGFAPLRAGTVTEIKDGAVTLQMDDGAILTLFR